MASEGVVGYPGHGGTCGPVGTITAIPIEGVSAALHPHPGTRGGGGQREAHAQAKVEREANPLKVGQSGGSDVVDVDRESTLVPPHFGDFVADHPDTEWSVVPDTGREVCMLRERTPPPHRREGKTLYNNTTPRHTGTEQSHT